MKQNREIESVVVDGGVEITTYNDGSESFRPVEKTDVKNKVEKGFLKRHRPRPYVKIRNLSDPFGKEGVPGKIGYEFGLRFDF